MGKRLVQAPAQPSAAHTPPQSTARRVNPFVSQAGSRGSGSGVKEKQLGGPLNHLAKLN